MTPTQKLEALIEARVDASDDRPFVDADGDLDAHDKTFYRVAVSFAATDAKAVLERLRRLEGALQTVLDVVGSCHDCWELSADDEQKSIVRAALAEKNK